MTSTAHERIWSRALAGEHTAVLGVRKFEPPASLWLLRVSCDVPNSTGGPIVNAQRKAAQMLGDQSAFLEQARDMLVTGLRRRFLGNVQERGPATARLVEACHRLSRHDRRYALLFDAVDAADDVTLEDLSRLLRRPGALALPLILVFRDRRLSQRAARLLGIVREVYGEDAVVGDEMPAQEPDEMTEPRELFDWRGLPFDVVQVLRAGAVIGSGFEADLLAELLECSPLDVLDCLQQAADAGAPIEDRGEGRFFLPEWEMDALLDSLLPSLEGAWHRRLGWLLGADEDEFEDEPESGAREWTDIRESQDDYRPPARVWDEPNVGMVEDESRPLQMEVEGLDYDDAAVTVERVPIQPPRFAEVFIRRSDPALAQADGADDAGANLDEDSVTVARRPVITRLEPPEPAEETSADSDDADADAGADADEEAEAEARAGTDADVDVDAMTSPALKPPPSGFSSGVANISPSSERMTVREIPARPRPRPSAQDSDDKSRYRDPARAASHLSAAGQLEAAARKYARAAGEASSIGAYEQAMVHGKQALQLIESLPDTAERRHFRAQMLVAIGRLQWQAAGTLDGHPDPAFTLERALETADLAKKLLEAGDPVELLAEAHSLVAGICYDLGTPKALERALEELTRAAQMFLSENQVIDAARLLNDQAAVYVRLGDPVRATHLLTESQRIFEERAEDDPVAIRELAETHHLLARLPLHARIRSGRESDAYEMAAEHTALAEQRYQQLGDVREIARTWETRGRIELMRGDLDEAAQRLTSALQVQSQLGDLTGLARSTAALSDVLAASHRYEDALAVLGDSIHLNHEKGSPIGLAFNRRAFDKLHAAISRSETELDTGLERTLADIDRHLRAAEEVLGRITLPGEP